ncbi:hypothetical protein LTR65_010266 [Meristemomyces frigidus]
MHVFSLLGAMASLAVAANALYFSVESLTATDKFDPATHTVAFTVSNPNAASEQGGSSAATCSLSWASTAVPTCWAECTGGSGQYYTKVNAGTYTSAAAGFALDIWQAYVNELGDHNNATVSVPSGGRKSTSYTCTSNSARGVCTESGARFNQTLQEVYGGADPVGAPIC